MDEMILGGVAVTRVEHRGGAAVPTADLLPDLDRAVWEANRSWLAPRYWDPVTDRAPVLVQSWVLRSAGQIVLIDTGLSGAPTRTGVPVGGGLTAALGAAGIVPGDVDLVVCTHLHADHVGGNTHPDGGAHVPAFPRARYLFSAPDLAFFDPRTATEGPGRSAAVFAESIAPVLDAGQALVWDGTHTIDENLRLTLAPGHTPGSAVLVVASDGDLALFVGDLLHSPLQVLRPDASSCFCHDPGGAARTRRAALAWAAEQRALVVPAHFTGDHAVRVRHEGTGFAIADGEPRRS